MPIVSISVIIVSWNVKKYLADCLSSLKVYKDSVPLEVIVVDNGSKDGSAEMVRAAYPWVKLIALPTNKGFANSNNLAVLQAQGEYILLLNPDTQVQSGFFTALLEFFVTHPKAGIVGGRISNIDGSLQHSVRRFPTLYSSVLDSLKILSFFPALAKKYLARDFDYNTAAVVDQVMGACFAIKRELWINLGGFDEEFWCWFEEVDLCKRAQNIGWQIWYNPNMRILHAGAASFKQLTRLERHRQFTHSLLYYFKKHHTVIEYLLVWLASRPAFLVAYLLDYASPVDRN